MLTEVAVQVVYDTGRFLLGVLQKSTIHGTVIGQDGKPISNADVSLYIEKGSNSSIWPVPIAKSSTALSGGFVFPKIPSNTYRISVRCGSYTFDNADVRYLAPGRELTMSISLPINGGNTQVDGEYHNLNQTHISLDVIVNGASLQTTHNHGKEFIFPRAGQEYNVRVINRWSSKLLAAVTVDGLSVMNGEPGGFDSGGYIMSPFSELVIPGWRLNNSEVAKFAFLSKEKSYACMTNRPTDIGVIACAMFEEKPPPPPPPAKKFTIQESLSFESNSSILESRSLESNSSILGTGFGRKVEHKVTEGQFDRKDIPSVIKRIYYVGGPQQTQSADFNPNPFPACKPPPDWTG